MKKIINNKLYDTATAVKIGSYSNGCGAGDFSHLHETLYRKKTGEYFLHGGGGAMTSYYRYHNGSWTGSERIIPYTEEEAKNWAERHLDADLYIESFGAVEE